MKNNNYVTFKLIIKIIIKIVVHLKLLCNQIDQKQIN